jgi:hypothetical protein
MTTIEEVSAEWNLDSPINQMKLSDEASRVPILHSKYLHFLIEFKAKYAATNRKLNQLKNIKRRYYRGEFTKSELDEYGWAQWQGLKPSMSELNQLFELDPDINEMEEKLEYWKTALVTVEYIMKSIQSRGYEIKTILEYKKFMEGN